MLPEPREAHTSCMAICDFKVGSHGVPIDLGGQSVNEQGMERRARIELTDLWSSCFSIV